VSLPDKNDGLCFIGPLFVFPFSVSGGFGKFVTDCWRLSLIFAELRVKPLQHYDIYPSFDKLVKRSFTIL